MNINEGFLFLIMIYMVLKFHVGLTANVSRKSCPKETRCRRLIKIKYNTFYHLVFLAYEEVRVTCSRSSSNPFVLPCLHCSSFVV